MFKRIQILYHTVIFYGYVLFSSDSPGTAAWKLFRNKKGKVRFITRDLICDSKTLMTLPKSENSLDEFTTAFSPFIPLLTQNGLPWKIRRKVLTNGLRKINLDKNFTINLPIKKGDIYWDIFEVYFRIGFELVFGRPPLQTDFDEMYPGIVDINSLIKRQQAYANASVRWKLYYRVVALLTQSSENFIFSESAEFNELSEIDRVSLIVEDLIGSICIQCTDLTCHLLLLYPQFRDLFKVNLDYCINETLRLYPLTDIWTRKAATDERAWIASLIQLNRSGWNEPDLFKPDRWRSNDQPPLISWGFDNRGCPASKIGYNLSKAVFQKIVDRENVWLQPASNYKHDRTFTDGCQIWMGEGDRPPSLQWKYKKSVKKSLQYWFSSRLRVLHQRELW